MSEIRGKYLKKIDEINEERKDETVKVNYLQVL